MLVVADGANTLTASAPGGYDPDRSPVQAALDDALAAGDADALTRLPDGIVGRVAYQVLAGLVGPSPCRPRELYRGAPYGVGYSVGRGGRRWHADSDGSGPSPIVGPTGTGKSALALDVAERLGGEIVNADAMQLYRGMDIGTAKLPVAERRGIPHHQLDVLDVTETATVGRYQQAAAADVEAITAPRGGAGDRRRIDAVRPVPARRVGLPGHRPRRCGPAGRPGSPTSAWRRCTPELARVDADAAASILPTDGRRIVRALEVVELTGQPFAASAPTIGEPRWDTVIIGLDWDTDVLDERLRLRTDAMFDDGLVDEVRRCGSAACATASRRRARSATRRCSTALDDGGGDDAIAEARERTFIGTRRYVRRQRSWFRRDHRIHWLDGSDAGNVDAALEYWRHVS